MAAAAGANVVLTRAVMVTDWQWPLEKPNQSEINIPLFTELTEERPTDKHVKEISENLAKIKQKLIEDFKERLWDNFRQSLAPNGSKWLLEQVARYKTKQMAAGKPVTINDIEIMHVIIKERTELLYIANTSADDHARIEEEFNRKRDEFLTAYRNRNKSAAEKEAIDRLSREALKNPDFVHLSKSIGGEVLYAHNFGRSTVLTTVENSIQVYNPGQKVASMLPSHSLIPGNFKGYVMMELCKTPKQPNCVIVQEETQFTGQRCVSQINNPLVPCKHSMTVCTTPAGKALRAPRIMYACLYDFAIGHKNGSNLLLMENEFVSLNALTPQYRNKMVNAVVSVKYRMTTPDDVEDLIGGMVDILVAISSQASEKMHKLNQKALREIAIDQFNKVNAGEEWKTDDTGKRYIELTATYECPTVKLLPNNVAIAVMDLFLKNERYRNLVPASILAKFKEHPPFVINQWMSLVKDREDRQSVIGKIERNLKRKA